MNKLIKICRFGVAVSGLLLAACGSQSPQPAQSQPTSPANFFIGEQPVYAHLIQQGGGSWVFKTVSESDVPPEQGYLVRLNDLAPAFDIRVAECEPQAYPAYHKCNPTQPFREKDIGVMDKIISSGIAAGTAGKVTGVSRTYRTAFDEAAFNQAVDEALINTGLGSARREFLLSLDRHSELLAEGQTRLTAHRQRTLSQYRNTQKVALDIRPRIAGLSEYYSADIDFRALVKLAPQAAEQPATDTFTAPPVLPCDARRCVDLARSATVKLRQQLERQSREQQTALGVQTAEYALQCDATSYAGYSFALDCPDTIPASGSSTETVPVTVTILSRDFEGLYPAFEIGDDNLNVEIDGDVVRFVNRTASYLSVVAQTVYYNSQVETRRQRIDVAPGVAVERPLDEFVTPAIRVESSFRQMTPDKANGTSFRFGFASSYRLAGAGKETTLYELREFNAGCVIENRIQPGSCRRSTAVAETEATPANSYALDEPQDLALPRD